MTRDRDRHQALAAELGAVWVGGAADPPPVKLDAAVIFAPAGELIPAALAALDKGGTLVLGGIYMSDTPPIPYELLYRERVVRSVANNTREDGREFLLGGRARPDPDPRPDLSPRGGERRPHRPQARRHQGGGGADDRSLRRERAQPAF